MYSHDIETFWRESHPCLEEHWYLGMLFFLPQNSKQAVYFMDLWWSNHFLSQILNVWPVYLYLLNIYHWPLKNKCRDTYHTWMVKVCRDFVDHPIDSQPFISMDGHQIPGLDEEHPFLAPKNSCKIKISSILGPPKTKPLQKKEFKTPIKDIGLYIYKL